MNLAASIAFAVLLAAPAATFAEGPAVTGSGASVSKPAVAFAPITGHLDGRVLVGGPNRVFILGPDGRVLWSHPSALTHDAWMLANGNVLFADGVSVTEVAPDGKIAFQYKSAEQHGGGTLMAIQRLDAEGRPLYPKSLR